MLVQALLGIVVLGALIAALVLVYRHMGRVSGVPEYEVARTMHHRPLWRRIIQFIASKQKLITAVVLAKIIRRLKVISLKTDNLSSRLLQKLEQERQEFRKRE